MGVNLDYVVSQVSALKLGEQVTVSRLVLSEISSEITPQWPLIGFYTNPVDAIMEKVVGSSYLILVLEDPKSRDVTFRRIDELPDNLRTWVSADRRDLYRRSGPYFIWKGNSNAKN